MIKTFDHKSSLQQIESDVMDAIKGVFHSERLILGPETDRFERNFAKFTGSKYCIGVNSGTTALQLSLMSLNLPQNSEVIVSANTCTPTISAIELAGLIPVLADVNRLDLMLNINEAKKKITKQTKVIMPVHLWGQSVDMDALMKLSEENKLSSIEDCAQAHGTTFRSTHVGNFGVAGCFSFYPTKNLGAYGEAGAIVTNDDELAEKIRRKRFYGYEDGVAVDTGMNARISEIQAAVLNVKLKHLPKWIEHRRTIAAIYTEEIKSDKITLLPIYNQRKHSYHQFVIRCKNRNEVVKKLKKNDIGYGIHYPVPVHKMPAYRYLDDELLKVSEKSCKDILSLPIHESITIDDAKKIAQIISN